MFNVHEYVYEKYGYAVEDYETDHGINGLDRLWSCTSEEEVDELLGDYL